MWLFAITGIALFGPCFGKVDVVFPFLPPPFSSPRPYRDLQVHLNSLKSSTYIKNLDLFLPSRCPSSRNSRHKVLLTIKRKRVSRLVPPAITLKKVLSNSRNKPSSLQDSSTSSRLEHSSSKTRGFLAHERSARRYCGIAVLSAIGGE